jgi:hypothetical protein
MLLCCTLFGSASAIAEEPDLTALRQQVNALEQQLHDVQAQLLRLESASPAAAPQRAPAPNVAPTPAKIEAGYLSPEAALRQSWSNIKPEVADSKVAEMLGEPTKKLKLDGRDVWYYYYPGTGRGSVFFTDEGRVTSSQSPFSWW